jgi:hypothetical protein
MNRTTFKNLLPEDLGIGPTAVMEPREVGRIWAEHYPNHRNDHVSGQICALICSLVRELARLEIGSGNLTMRVAKVLGAAGIPIEQFDDCEAEVKKS